MLKRNKANLGTDLTFETSSIDEVTDTIILLNKIEIAREQFKNGEFLTEDELYTEIEKWK